MKEEKRSARYPRATATASLLTPASHKQPRDSAVPLTDRSATSSDGLPGPRRGSEDPVAVSQRPEDGSRVHPAARSPPAPSEGRRAGPATPESSRSPRPEWGRNAQRPPRTPRSPASHGSGPRSGALPKYRARPRARRLATPPRERASASTRRVRACAREGVGGGA